MTDKVLKYEELASSARCLAGSTGTANWNAANAVFQITCTPYKIMEITEDFDCVTAERDALQAQLAARESELEEFSVEMTLAISDSQIRSAMTVVGRSRFLQLLQAYNARIDAALKPAEAPTHNAKPTCHWACTGCDICGSAGHGNSWF
jgi:hypothetical protein